jgi:hypothetical protein
LLVEGEHITSAGSILQNDVRPPLESGFGDVKLPVNSFQEHQLVLIDFSRVQTRNLAPSTSGIVAVLKIF